MCRGVGLTPFPFSEEQQTIDRVPNRRNIDKHCSEPPRKLQRCRVDISAHRVGHSNDSAPLHISCLQKLLALYISTHIIGHPDGRWFYTPDTYPLFTKAVGSLVFTGSHINLIHYFSFDFCKFVQLRPFRPIVSLLHSGQFAVVHHCIKLWC